MSVIPFGMIGAVSWPLDHGHGINHHEFAWHVSVNWRSSE